MNEKLIELMAAIADELKTNKALREEIEKTELKLAK